MSGVHDVGACAILKEVEQHDGSTIVESALKFWGRGIASEDICHKLHSLACCHIWRKENLVDDVFDDLRFR